VAQDGRSLVWMDLEMTGLYPEKDRIIEMATVITDSDLRIIAEGPVIAIKQPKPSVKPKLRLWTLFNATCRKIGPHCVEIVSVRTEDSCTNICLSLASGCTTATLM